MSKQKDFVKWDKAKEASDPRFLDLVLGAAWESIALLLLVFVSLYLLRRVSGVLQLDGEGVRRTMALIVGGTCFYEILVRGFLLKIDESRRRIVSFISKVLPGVLGSWFFVTSFQNRKQEIQSGISAIEAIFIRLYNRLYGTNVAYLNGERSLIPSSLYFLVITAVFVCLIVSWTGRRKWIYLCFPVLGTSALMMVGLAPRWKHVLVVACGAFMIYLSHRKKNAWRGMLLAAATFVILIAVLGGLFTKAAENLLQHSKEVKVYEEKLEAKIQSFFSGTRTSNIESIANSTPKYKDVKILTVTSQSKPAGNLYLQEFYGENYEQGTWYPEYTEFYQTCEEHDLSPAQAALYLTSSLYDLSTVNHAFCEIDYQGALGKNMFLPYGTDVEDVKGLLFRGDSISVKESSGKVSFTALSTNLFEALTDINDEWILDENGPVSMADLDLSKIRVRVNGVEMTLEELSESENTDIVAIEVLNEEELERQLTFMSVVYSDPTGYVSEGRSEEENDFWTWYNEYVYEHCMDYPEYMSELTVYEHISGRAVLKDMENYVRMDIVGMIHNILNSRGYTYSWNLKDLDNSQDSIEYFLKTSHKGYCIHYASAGVFLLRCAGVPARYASGYVVKPSQFVLQEDGSYKASVIDRNKHAWVEVFLKDVGWIPVEMTPGYQDPNDEMPTSKEAEKERREKEAKEEAQEEASSEAEESGEVTPTESPSPTPETTQTPEVEQEKPEKAGQKETAKPGKEQGGQNIEGEEESKDLGILLYVLVPAGVLFLGFILYRLIKLHKENHLKKLLRGKYYKAAVIIMNRRVYRRLRRKGKLRGGKPTDRDYERSLKEVLGEESHAKVEEYMRIVKAAAFSGGTLSKEDCMTVWHFYRQYGSLEL